MPGILEKPLPLTRDNEQRVVQMMKEVLQATWGETMAKQVEDLIEERMRHFRESLEKQPASNGMPPYLQEIIARATKGQEQPEIPDTAKQLIEQGGLYMIKGNGADMLSRVCVAIAAAKHLPKIGADGWYKDRYGEDDVFKQLMATDAVAGGFLVPEAMSMTVIELLRPASVFMQMNPMIETMETGAMNIPGFATGAAASYIGETENIQATQPTFRRVDLVAKKLAAIVPISNDLIRRRSGASPMVRDDLVAAMAEKMDQTFIRSDGTNGEPRGLRYLADAGNILQVNATVNTENVYADLGRLILALLNNNVRMIRPGWLMAPRTWMALMLMTDALGNTPLRAEMSQGRLFGFPFRFSNNIPINLAVTGTAESEIYLVDWADIVVGQTTSLILDVSTEASYYDGSTLQSAYSRDLSLLRSIIEHDLNVRHQASIAILNDVDWITGITT